MLVSAASVRSGCRDEHGLGALRLDDHHRQAVRHDVVQLAGDPAALGGDRERGALLLLAFEVVGAGLQGGQMGAPGPGAVGDRPGGGEQQGRHGRRLRGVEQQGHDIAVQRRRTASWPDGRSRCPAAQLVRVAAQYVRLDRQAPGEQECLERPIRTVTTVRRAWAEPARVYMVTSTAQVHRR